MEKLSPSEIIFEEPNLNNSNNYKIENVQIKIEKTNDLNNLRNKDTNSIFAILDGGLKSENNLLVLSPGDIVGGNTIKKLTEVFKIDNYITFLMI